MSDKNISIISIIAGIIFLATVKWDKTTLTESQKQRRSTTIIMGFLLLLGGVFILITSAVKQNN